jgi:hypothetical protein
MAFTDPNAVQPWVHPQQAAHGLVASGIVGAADRHVAGRAAESAPGQRRAVSLQAPQAARVLRALDVRDVTAAPGGQVLSGRRADLDIISPHEGRLHTRQSPIDQHARQPALLQAMEHIHLGCGQRRSQDQPVYLRAGQQQLQGLAFRLCLALRVRQQHHVAHRTQHPRHRFGYFRVMRIQQVRHYQADDVNTCLQLSPPTLRASRP